VRCATACRGLRPGGQEALARIWRYIFVVSNPPEPAELVKRLVGVVGKEREEAVMNVAEWLEQKGSGKPSAPPC
jgi:hypothetical protein